MLSALSNPVAGGLDFMPQDLVFFWLAYGSTNPLFQNSFLPWTFFCLTRASGGKRKSSKWLYPVSVKLKGAYLCLWASISFLFFVNLWLTPTKSSSKRWNWEDLLKSEMLAWKPSMFITRYIHSIGMYLFNILKCIAYHWVSVPEGFILTTCGIWGCGRGKESGKEMPFSALMGQGV